MRKLLGLMTVLATGAIISTGCGTSEETTSTESQKATIEGDATNIEDYVDLLNGDVKAQEKIIKDTVAKVKTPNGKVYYVDGYFFRKEENNTTKLYFAIPNIPLNAEVSIIFVKNKYKNTGKEVKVNPEEVVASTPDIKVISPKIEIKVDKVEPKKKIAIVKPENINLPVAFELLNTTIDKTQNIKDSNFKHVGNINVEGDEVHLYWNNNDNKLLALDVTNANASVVVGNTAFNDLLDDVKEMKIVGKNVYLMIYDSTNAYPGSITLLKDEKIKFNLTTSQAKVKKNFSKYEILDDGMYAYVGSAETINIDTTAPDKDGNNPSSNSKTLSTVSIAKWPYDNYTTSVDKKESKVNLKLELEFKNKKGTATLKLTDTNKTEKEILKVEVTGDGDSLNKAKATVQTKYKAFSTSNLKEIYNENVYVYTLADVKVSVASDGADSNGVYSVVAFKYNPFDLSKSYNASIKLEEGKDIFGNAKFTSIEVKNSNSPQYVVFKYRKIDTNSTIYKVDFTRETLSIDRVIEAKAIVKWDAENKALAFCNGTGDGEKGQIYVCNLEKNICERVYESENKFTDPKWIKILNIDNEDNLYLILNDNNNNFYLVKYNLSSGDKQVEKASGDTITNAPELEKVADDNPDVMVVKEGTSYYLINFKRNFIEKLNISSGDTLSNIEYLSSKGPAIANINRGGSDYICYTPDCDDPSSSWDCDSNSPINLKFDPETGKATILFENGTSGLYYKVCTSEEECKVTSSITFAGEKAKQIKSEEKCENKGKYEYISYTQGDNYTDVYIYKLIADDEKATINVDSFKFQNATGYEFKDVIKLDLDVLVKDPNYYYLFKERNN